jgi:phage-related protein
MVSYAVDMTTRGTPGRMIRIDDEMWDLYGQLCAEEGTTRTDELRRHIHSRVRAYCKAKGIEAPKPKRFVRVPRKKPAADSD